MDLQYSTSMRIGESPYFIVPYTNTAPNPIVSRTRPGIHEKRRDAEPRVYCELPSFPSFDEPIPPETSLEEICSKYPNHLRGSYLDAFIQWHWSGTDMYTCLTQAAINDFKAFGITTCKTFANRANFLTKRLDARLSALSADEVTALCMAPKIRPCMINGTEKYGASKLQGKFHNPNAPAIRRYPHRHRDGRTPGVSTLMKTFVHNNQEYQLWDSAKELQGYSQSMATYWGYQRARAEEIIDADPKYCASRETRRNILILEMTNWPCNAATETFFSFQHIQDCLAFENLIFDLVVTTVTDMLGSSPPADIAHNLPLARQSAVSYVLTAQKARLARLKGVLTASRAGRSTGSLVDQVMSWNTDFEWEVSYATETDRKSQEEAVHSLNQSDLGTEGSPHTSDPVTPLKQETPDATTAVQPVKRVRFADTVTEFEPANQTRDVDVEFEELQQDTDAGMLSPDSDLSVHHANPAIEGEDVFFTHHPPMQVLLKEFDLDRLPLTPLPDCLDVLFDLAAEDYSDVFEDNDPECARLFSEAATQHDVAMIMTEDETTMSWELPELVENDPDWLREAIGNAPERLGNEIATLRKLHELGDNDPDWLKEVIGTPSGSQDGYA
ncbi:hypothetical protein AYL99_10022 [Fonsecaea erecta]|uniref:Uncharacterized protein n=1 Tax=Fonsecaea erecta TaxID=1367422 RepID=A0A178Z7V7_9EURO|nr:hypothetical protein AYL99_10022 [Fonsecaea erecta]OAP55870.1 hypothetical protein AYL99_10022 [Fonsecaea erecta]